MASLGPRMRAHVFYCPASVIASSPAPHVVAYVGITQTLVSQALFANLTRTHSSDAWRRWKKYSYAEIQLQGPQALSGQ